MTKIAELKQENIQKIRTCFYDGNIHTKTELSKQTNLSLAAVTNTLQYLLDSNEIQLQGKADSTGGRKSKQYVLNASYKTIGTMILQKYKEYYEITLSLYHLDQEEIYQESLQSKQGDFPFVQKAIQKLQHQNQPMDILTISIPGISHNGTIQECDWEGLQNQDFGNKLQEQLHIPVIIENDVNVACIGFSYKYPHIQNLAYVYQPKTDYTGCGLLIHGRLFNGHNHAAGELRFLPNQPSNPQEILEYQLTSICALFNPELIAYHSDFDCEEPIQLLPTYPKAYWPKLIPITDIKQDIQDGLFHIAKDTLLKGEKENV